MVAVPLTPKQQAALEKADSFLLAGDPDGEFVFSGLAGTGKTTTMVQLLDRLKERGSKPAVCAPTGKAAHVINSKQNTYLATTLHRVLTQRPIDFLKPIHEELDSLELQALQAGGLTPDEQARETELLRLLDSKQRDGNNLSFEPVDVDDFMAHYDSLIFDESSMIGRDKTYLPLIARIPVPKLFLGDGAQLPPVKDACAINFSKPDAHLDEILRQGADSGILQFAHKVHRGSMMTAAEASQYPDLKVVGYNDSTAIRGFEDHQVIVWRNEERHMLCPILRRARGIKTDPHYPYLPAAGDVLMVDENSEETRLMRGQLLTVKALTDYKQTENPYNCHVSVVDDRGRDRDLKISLTDMIPESRRLIPSEDSDRKVRWKANKNGLLTQWSYAITAHKSQGSEYDKVLLFGSMTPGRFNGWQNWWYTAATRAKKQLVIASSYFTYG